MGLNTVTRKIILLHSAIDLFMLATRFQSNSIVRDGVGDNDDDDDNDDNDGDVDDGDDDNDDVEEDVDHEDPGFFHSRVRK